jgi:alpha-maltose-1-phosphate synthase
MHRFDPCRPERFGIMNLEAMACEMPVGLGRRGITEVVVPGRTGLLVPIEAVGDGKVEPKDPARFARDLGGAINRLR